MNERNPHERRSPKRDSWVTDSVFSYLVRPRAILFGIAMFYFVVSSITVTRFVENPFVEAPRWYFVWAMTRPFVLLLGAAGLLINSSWSLALAILLAGNILYLNLFRAFVGISNAHGIPVFGASAVRIWFQIMSTEQLMNTALAVVIFVLASVQLSRWLVRRMRKATTTGGESPTNS